MAEEALEAVILSRQGAGILARLGEEPADFQGVVFRKGFLKTILAEVLRHSNVGAPFQLCRGHHNPPSGESSVHNQWPAEIFSGDFHNHVVVGTNPHVPVHA